MQTFKEIFEAYGADYETTMERFMGSEETYREFLDMLFDDDNLANLGEAIESGNLDMAFEAAHTLKGVAGNMGLKRLYAAVCDMVDPLRRREQRNDYDVLYESVKTEFHEVDKLRQSLKKGERI